MRVWLVILLLLPAASAEPLGVHLAPGLLSDHALAFGPVPEEMDLRAPGTLEDCTDRLVVPFRDYITYDAAWAGEHAHRGSDYPTAYVPLGLQNVSTTWVLVGGVVPDARIEISVVKQGEAAFRGYLNATLAPTMDHPDVTVFQADDGTGYALTVPLAQVGEAWMDEEWWLQVEVFSTALCPERALFQHASTPAFRPMLVFEPVHSDSRPLLQISEAAATLHNGSVLVEATVQHALGIPALETGWVPTLQDWNWPGTVELLRDGAAVEVALERTLYHRAVVDGREERPGHVHAPVHMSVEWWLHPIEPLAPENYAVHVHYPATNAPDPVDRYLSVDAATGLGTFCSGNLCESQVEVEPAESTPWPLAVAFVALIWAQRRAPRPTTGK